ncbi:hypothetical protein BD779DRAFT_1666338 [Infundibulicybe gibba]|nr:hypothetical protein BD779DRAFT_1666338 [Infundibulicybe gibba]
MGKRGKRGKKAQSPEEEPEAYHVEVITKARVVALSDSEEEDDRGSGDDGQGGNKVAKPVARWEYYVKWAGYDSDANSWEPDGNVAGCERLLKSFWDHIGMDSGDYPVGHMIEANEKWISCVPSFDVPLFCLAVFRILIERVEKERKYFAREFLQSQEDHRREKGKAKVKEKEPEKKKIKKPDKSIKIVIPATSSSRGSQGTIDSDSDEPLVSSAKKRKRGRSATSPSETPPRGREPPHKISKTNKGKGRVVDDSDDEPSLFSDHSSREASTSATAAPATSRRPRPLPLPIPRPLTKPALVSSLPKIPRKLPNPHAALANKATRALAPTNPKSLSAARPEKPNTLRSLSFKKTIPSTRDSNQIASSDSLPLVEPTLSALNAPPHSRESAVSVSPLEPTFGDSITATSPQDYSMSDDQALPSFLDYTWPMSPPVDQPPRNSQIAQAEDFLQTVMPAQLAAPLTPAVEEQDAIVPPRPLVSRKPLPLPRIPKKWAWAGAIHVIPMGMRFSVAMTSVGALQFLSFHDCGDLPSFLSACKPVQHLARLDPKETKDLERLTTVAKYMDLRKKVIMVPIYLDEQVIGHMIFFPPTMQTLCARFNVPTDPNPSLLVAGLFPWALTPTQLAREWRKPHSALVPAQPEQQPMISDKAQWERSIRDNPTYQRALRVLQFPKDLHDWMAEPGRIRTFCIWNGDTGPSKTMTLETIYLCSIMQQCKATKCDTKTDTRVIFVHIGALATLHKLPGYFDRRINNVGTRFITYGTHHSVPPPQWGIREIYVAGGVVTLTPKSLVEDPIGALHRIKELAEHPIWMSYILPSVLGMAAKLFCPGEDPLTLFDCGKFPLHYLLTAIVDGEIALLYSPPLQRNPIAGNDASERWLLDVFAFPDGPRAILESSIEAFNDKCTNVPESDWASMIEEHITSDLASIRRQPCIMENYRRYVVLVGESETNISPQKEGFEWTTINKFDFRDNFFLGKTPTDPI